MPGRADSIVVALGDRLTTADPHQVRSFADDLLVRTLHTGLVQYGADGRVQPGLAESWTVSANGRVYAFTLAEGLTWSDGRTLTAEDFRAGFERALSFEQPATFAAKLYGIENAPAFSAGSLDSEQSLGIEVVDERTIVIALERRTNTFLDTLTHPVAMPVPADDPEAVANGDVTSGAYTLERFSPANLKHRESGPDLEFRSFAAAADAWQLIRQNEAVVTAALPLVTVPPVGDYGDVVQRDPATALYAYGVNMARTPFSTLEVRHALAMAISRPSVMEALPRNTGMPATTYIPAALMGGIGSYKAPFASLTFEEREAVAAALLAEQGFGRSNPITVRLRIPLGPDHRAVAEAVARMWATAGLNTIIVEAPFPDHWAAVARGDFEVAYMHWPGRLNSPLTFINPLSAEAGSWNFPLYTFADFSERVTRANAEDDLERRLGYVREAEKAIIEDQALIALFHYRPLTFVAPAVRGWIPNEAGLHPLSSLTLERENRGPRLTPMPAPVSVPSFGEPEIVDP